MSDFQMNPADVQEASVQMSRLVDRMSDLELSKSDDAFDCTTRGRDTPATRCQRASCSAKPPHRPQRRAPRHPTGRLGHQGTVAECDTNSQWLGPTVSLRRLETTAGPEVTSWTQYGRRTDQQEVPRSDVQLGSAATHIVPSPEICILCSPPLKSVC